MEGSQSLEDCISKVESEEDSDDSVEEITPDITSCRRKEKLSNAADEEVLLQPTLVTVGEYKGEGFYSNMLPTVSSAQASQSLSRPHANIQLQWKGENGIELAAQVANNEQQQQQQQQQQQWIDNKGVVTISAANVGAPWITTADGQGFPDGIVRDGTILKDGNIQYVLMASADQFYLVESGENNAICGSDGSIKNIVAGDKNIQMISIVPNQNIANSEVSIGGMASDQGTVPEGVEELHSSMGPASSSNKRNHEPATVLSTIAMEDCDLKHSQPLRKKKKPDKAAVSVGFEDRSVKKACDLNSCPFRCTAVFDEDERENINRAFHLLPLEDQKAFVIQCCDRKMFLKDMKACNVPSKINFKFDFQLRSAKGVPVQVCNLFFASTLGFTDDAFNNYLSDLYKSTPPERTRSNQCTCTGVTNTRHRGKASAGKWAASCKLHSDVYSHVHKDVFHRHIESFLRTLCIPQGEHVRTVRYLPKDVSISMMFADFTLKHPDIYSSYELYKNFVVLFTS